MDIKKLYRASGTKLTFKQWVTKAIDKIERHRPDLIENREILDKEAVKLLMVEHEGKDKG